MVSGKVDVIVDVSCGVFVYPRLLPLSYVVLFDCFIMFLLVKKNVETNAKVSYVDFTYGLVKLCIVSIIIDFFQYFLGSL